MPTPSIQTLRADAQQVLNLDSISAVRSVVAATLANANAGTPLNPNLTTQQLWNEFYQIVTQPKSDIESIIANQLMKFLYLPPAPGGVGANKQVIWNDAGVLAGDPNFTWDGPLSLLTVTGSATITGDLTVDTSTLKVDSANDRVGIGTASPAAGAKLGVLGATSVSTSDYIASSTWAARFIGSSNGASSGISFLTNSSGGFPTPASIHATPIADYRSALVLTYSADSSGAGYFAVNRSSPIGATTLEHYKIDNAGVATWSNVGGVAGTAMTLNSTGLGVGVTPSAWATYKAVSVGGIGASVFGLGSSQAGVAQGAFFNNGSGSGWAYSATSQVPAYYLQINGEHRFHNAVSGTAGNQITAWTQAMTLDASGNLLVKKTAADLTVGAMLLATGVIESTLAGSTSATNTMNVYSTGAGAYRFYVNMAGTVFATNTTISAISDARLKENVQDIDVGLSAILSLKPRKFDWKAGKGKDIKGDRGFIAQEFEQVFPNLVDEWKDNAPEGEAPYKSVRQDLIPVLVKAIQELTARVEALEA